MTQAIIAEFSDDDISCRCSPSEGGAESPDGKGRNAGLLTDLRPLHAWSTAVAEVANARHFCSDARAREPFHVVFVMDASGSMRQEDVSQGGRAACLRRSDAVLQALVDFVDSQQASDVSHSDLYSMISFNRRAATHFSFESAPLARAQLCELLDQVEPRDITNYMAALQAVAELMSSRAVRPGEEHFRILLFSDGRPGDAPPMLRFFQREICCSSTAARGSLEFHTVGFGDLDDFVCLQQMSAIGRGTFQLAGRSTMALQLAFSTISATISQGTQCSCSQGLPLSSCSGVEFEQPCPIGEAMPRKEAFMFRCTRHSFHYNGTAMLEARPEEAMVLCRPRPWTRGGLHVVYAMQDRTLTFYDPAQKRLCPTYMAGKVMRSPQGDSRTNIRTYAQNVAVACWCAKMFRHSFGQGSLFFVPCYFYDSIRASGTDAPLPDFKEFASERHIHGVFTKYNSNRGYVLHGPEESLLAQAFSHYSFELTKGEMMIVDLQGVCLWYGNSEEDAKKLPFFLLLSDPQVLSRHKGFGLGDLGVEGMDAFFASHRCNSACRHLGLPSRERAFGAFRDEEADRKPTTRVWAAPPPPEARVRERPRSGAGAEEACLSSGSEERIRSRRRRRQRPFPCDDRGAAEGDEAACFDSRARRGGEGRDGTVLSSSGGSSSSGSGSSRSSRGGSPGARRGSGSASRSRGVGADRGDDGGYRGVPRAPPKGRSPGAAGHGASQSRQPLVLELAELVPDLPKRVGAPGLVLGVPPGMMAEQRGRAQEKEEEEEEEEEDGDAEAEEEEEAEEDENEEESEEEDEEEEEEEEDVDEEEEAEEEEDAAEEEEEENVEEAEAVKTEEDKKEHELDGARMEEAEEDEDEEEVDEEAEQGEEAAEQEKASRGVEKQEADGQGDASRKKAPSPRRLGHALVGQQEPEDVEEADGEEEGDGDDEDSAEQGRGESEQQAGGGSVNRPKGATASQEPAADERGAQEEPDGMGACCSEDGDAEARSPSAAPMVWPDTDSEPGCSDLPHPMSMPALIWPASLAQDAEEEAPRPQTPQSGTVCSLDRTSASVGSCSAQFRAAAPEEDAELEAAVYAVEEILEAAGHSELADRLFVWLASGQSKRVVASLLRLHYDESLRPKQHKDQARFVRRIALLVGERTPSLSGVGSVSNGCSDGGMEGGHSLCSFGSMDLAQAALTAEALHCPGYC